MGMGVRKPPIPITTLPCRLFFLWKKGSAYFSGKEVNPMHEPTTRRALTGAIVKLLAAADFRQLRLVWVYASHLIG